MGVNIKKDSIDIGIVARDGEAALKFYRDVLGLKHVADMPAAGGGTMHRLACGTTVVKIIASPTPPAAANPPGGLAGGTGIRYWTITVDNLDEMAQAAGDAGYKVPVAPREIRPGVRIAMIEDPDGNWVELLEMSA